MSYDVELVDPVTGQPLPSPEHFEEGGTRAFGGANLCELNVTYNYAEVYGGLVRDLNGRPAVDTIPELEEFCDLWKYARPYERDYWAPTPGNACAAIARLLSFARAHPDGVWMVL